MEYSIDPYKRFQEGLKVIHLFPSIPGVCACGCGEVLEGRQKRWASPEHGTQAHRQWAIIQGRGNYIRDALRERDKGVCAHCGIDASRDGWHADHITPVFMGGGGCDLDGYQTLCIPCHKVKTKVELREIYYGRT
jgi:5-methylcytosine-specific restriction endonuclease McrA